MYHSVSKDGRVWPVCSRGSYLCQVTEVLVMSFHTSFSVWSSVCITFCPSSLLLLSACSPLPMAMFSLTSPSPLSKRISCEAKQVKISNEKISDEKWELLFFQQWTPSSLSSSTLSTHPVGIPRNLFLKGPVQGYVQVIQQFFPQLYRFFTALLNLTSCSHCSRYWVGQALHRRQHLIPRRNLRKAHGRSLEDLPIRCLSNLFLKTSHETHHSYDRETLSIIPRFPLY